MSTRCRLGYKDRENGDYVTVYRHCDGYPEGAGLDVYNTYPTYEKVSTKLLKDYDEDWVERFDTIEDIYKQFEKSDLEYIYIFEDDDEWYCSETVGYNRELMKNEVSVFKPLTELFKRDNIEYQDYTNDEATVEKSKEIREQIDVIKAAIDNIETLLNS